MSTTRPTPLTERQRFWREHLRRCGDSPLGAYAAAHGLSASSLYQARARCKRLGLLDSPAPVRLLRVEHTESPATGAASVARARITLRNGAAVELAFDAEQWPALLAGVAALP